MPSHRDVVAARLLASERGRAWTASREVRDGPAEGWTAGLFGWPAQSVSSHPGSTVDVVQVA